MYKLKLDYFTAEGTESQYSPQVGFMKRNVWETQTMDQVITLPLDKMMRSNIHMQGDTILIEFYLA